MTKETETEYNLQMWVTSCFKNPELFPDHVVDVLEFFLLNSWHHVQFYSNTPNMF